MAPRTNANVHGSDCMFLSCFLYLHLASPDGELFTGTTDDFWGKEPFISRHFSRDGRTDIRQDTSMLEGESSDNILHSETSCYYKIKAHSHGVISCRAENVMGEGCGNIVFICRARIVRW